MTKADLINTLTRAFYKTVFQVKKHSPEILIATGIVGVTASTVLACRATTKTGAIIEEAKAKIDGVHQVLESPELKARYVEKYGEEFDDKASKKELAAIYVKTGLDFAKLYGPSVLLGVASIACILTSHRIIRGRNVALAAAYATIDRGFKDYRGRVIERFGKELDRELRYDIKSKEIEEVVVNEDGTKQTVTKTVNTIEPARYSGYARCFDETCAGWTRNAEENLWFLLQQQSFATKKLQTEGYLFLNDVYEMLGMQKSAAGQQIGWIYDEKNPVGDNYVDFGIHDLHDEAKRLFVNGYEKSIWIDPNVDGYILDLMP